MALTYSKENFIGDNAPDFVLPGVDGKNHSLENILHGKKAAVLMFICNHCPYVIANYDRLIGMANAYQEKGIAFVGINSNDEINYPDDSFDKMVELAKDRNLPFPYLRDKDQTVAKAYDAACTPEVYIVNSKQTVIYHGGIDDSWNDESKITQAFLRNALDDICADREVAAKTPSAMGCSIKWSV